MVRIDELTRDGFSSDSDWIQATNVWGHNYRNGFKILYKEKARHGSLKVNCSALAFYVLRLKIRKAL